MGTKAHPGEFDCYAAAEADEPMFILLGRDDVAPERVEEWARKRFAKAALRMVSTHPSGCMMVDDGKTDQVWLMPELRKIANALQIANDMREWKINKAAKDKLAGAWVYPWPHPLPIASISEHDRARTTVYAGADFTRRV